MTRKEEIDTSCNFEDKRDEYWNKIVPDSKSLWDAYVFGYYAGAEWADKTMIDKVCEWLRNNIDFYVETKYDEDFRVDIEQLLKDICKTMEV